jgi:hypothetical protein
MHIGVVSVIALLAISACIVPAHAANSCANLDVFGSYDRSGLDESGTAISAVGSFRIQNEPDENKQPNFNLAMISCDNQPDESGRSALVCKVIKAVTWATNENPNPDKPNCSLDLDSTEYAMKQLQKGVLVGAEDSTTCFNSMLTIDRNTKRVYLSFTRSQYADNYDRRKSGTCGQLPRTEVLMNCTSWAKMRKQGATPARYCDFSSSSDK